MIDAWTLKNMCTAVTDPLTYVSDKHSHRVFVRDVQCRIRRCRADAAPADAVSLALSQFNFAS